jgi:glycosyltransferase involved in cell wall biosynthesis
MKALCIARIPEDAERKKAKEPESFTIMGVGVYCAEFFAALLRYSTYDAIVLPRLPESRYDCRQSPLFRKYASRVAYVDESNLSTLGTYDRSVICQFNSTIAESARWRRLSGCSGAPITGTIHALNYGGQLRSIFELMAASLEPFDALVCSSRAGHNALLAMIDTVKDRIGATGARGFDVRLRTPIIPLGVDAEAFAGSGNNLRSTLELGDSTAILYFGRLSHTSKADLVPVLIAFAQIVRDGSNAVLILAGDDTHFKMAERLREIAAALGCAERVRVLPNVAQELKHDLYRAADIFLAPSDNLQETFGITVVEAMAAGLPVVAADWDGYKDTVADGVTGYLVPSALPILPASFDNLRGSRAMTGMDLLAAGTIVSVPALYRALRALVWDTEKRAAFGAAARARAKSLYDWPVIVRAYEDLWDELIDLAAQSPKGLTPPVLDLEQYDYRKIFAHYPTSSLTMDSPLALSPSALVSLDQYAELMHHFPDMERMFPVEGMRAMLAAVAGGSATIGSLVARHKEASDADGALAMAGISRMLKYDLCYVPGQAEIVCAGAVGGALPRPPDSCRVTGE